LHLRNGEAKQPQLAIAAGSPSSVVKMRVFCQFQSVTFRCEPPRDGAKACSDLVAEVDVGVSE
jgi:hypothetical protein